MSLLKKRHKFYSVYSQEARIGVYCFELNSKIWKLINSRGVDGEPMQFNYMNFHVFTKRVHIELTVNDQLPVGLIAQWIERCAGIPEVQVGSNLVQA